MSLNTYCTCVRALRVAQLINESKIQYLDSLLFCLDGFLDKCKKTADFVLKQRICFADDSNSVAYIKHSSCRILYHSVSRQDHG